MVWFWKHPLSYLHPSCKFWKISHKWSIARRKDRSCFLLCGLLMLLECIALWEAQDLRQFHLCTKHSNWFDGFVHYSLTYFLQTKHSFPPSTYQQAPAVAQTTLRHTICLCNLTGWNQEQTQMFAGNFTVKKKTWNLSRSWKYFIGQFICAKGLTKTTKDLT